MRTSDVSTTLTLGRDARSRPDRHSTQPAPEGRSNHDISSIEAWLCDQGRMRVYHAWQQALSAAERTDAHVGRPHNANPRS